MQTLNLSIPPDVWRAYYTGEFGLDKIAVGSEHVGKHAVTSRA